jgi:hypothetical protein
MNVQRVLINLQRVNLALQQPQNHETMKALKRGKRKWEKMLQQFTNPTAPARPLPQRNHHQIHLPL